jgi:hypothetical protein
MGIELSISYLLSTRLVEARDPEGIVAKNPSEALDGHRRRVEFSYERQFEETGNSVEGTAEDEQLKDVNDYDLSQILRRKYARVLSSYINCCQDRLLIEKERSVSSSVEEEARHGGARVREAMIEAASSAFRAGGELVRRRRSAADPVEAAELLYEVSRFWMKSTFEIEDQSHVGRLRCLEEHLNRIKSLRSTLDAAVHAYAISEAEFWLLREQVDANVSTDFEDSIPADVSLCVNGALKALANERLRTARTVCERTWMRGPSGLSYLWSLRWLRAQLALANGANDRIAAFVEHRDRMMTLEAHEKDSSIRLSREGPEAEYFTAEAEFWLAREKAR